MVQIRNKNILITGGSGFIGSWLVEKFSKENTVTVFDNNRRNSLKFLPDDIKSKIKYYKGDIKNVNTVRKIAKKQSIVIHLAAIAGASSYEKDPILTIKTNFLGTLNLLESLDKSTTEHVILFSTSEVYGPLATKVKETDPTCIGSIFEKRWTYAVSKVASDHLAMSFFKEKKTPITIVRPFNIYGPRQVGEGAIKNMIDDSIKKRVITITGSGRQERSWCYIEDMVRAVELIIAKRKFGNCFNIGNPDCNISANYLAKMIAAKIGGVKLKHTAGKKTEIYKRKPDVSLAKILLGWKPKVDIDAGLDRTISWYEDRLS